VQETIGTIIILAIAVVLAGIVIYWVNAYPVQTANQTDVFSVNLTYGGSVCVLNCGGGGHGGHGGHGGGGGGGTNTTGINTIKIELLAGPPIAGASVGVASVRLQSQQVPSAFTQPFSLPTGLGGSGSWQPGQTWSLNLTTYRLPYYDNLTVIVDSANQLVLNEVTPGPNPVSAPYFTSVEASPSSVAPGGVVVISCTLVAADGLTISPAGVSVNLTEIDKGTKLFEALTLSSGVWSYSYTVPSSGQNAGTFYVFLTAIDNYGIQTETSVPVTVT
jgi:hypothetical protein